jgi:hypothetical protein
MNSYDRWGRIVGKVVINGDDANLEQIRAGLAWHYKRYESEQSLTDRQTYAEAEGTARAQRREIWREANPVPPWEFRHHATGASDGAGSADVDEPSQPAALSGEVPHAQTRTTPASSPTADAAEEIRGNKRTMIYHWRGCPNYDDIALHNRISFKTREEAEAAGYRAAKNCK